MKRQTKTSIDNEINRIYCSRCQGIQINIMDIGKVFAAGRAAALAGRSIEEAVLGAVAALGLAKAGSTLDGVSR